MKLLIIAASLLVIGSSACVDNEEEITIHPDGSSSVRISAKGKAEDLSDGYGLPLLAPWTPTNAETSEWIRLIGPDVGSPAARETLTHLTTSHGAINAEREMKLEVRADFASVKDWPRWFAPESEVYRSAYLERNASLVIESKSGRKVYTFQRTFHAREFERFDLGSSIKRNVPEELFAKIDGSDKQATLSPEERAKLTKVAVQAVQRTSLAFATDALVTTYTSGDASLPTGSLGRAVAYVQGRVAAVADEQRVSEVLAWELDHDRQPTRFPADNGTTTANDPRSGKQLESDIRGALRTAVSETLRLEGVPVASQNAIRAELEWHLTAYDATCDLADEGFKVTVHMPGVIVGGNCTSIGGSEASWKFDGKDLLDRERVMRVVSVVE